MSGGPILLVEDDPDIREALRGVLEEEGYGVEEAENGRAALDRLHGQRPPSLILLDWMMPIMDGSEFLTAMRQESSLEPIPVVVVSAWTEAAKEEANGVQGFLQKPVHIDDLLATAARHCRD